MTEAQQTALRLTVENSVGPDHIRRWLLDTDPFTVVGELLIRFGGEAERRRELDQVRPGCPFPPRSGVTIDPPCEPAPEVEDFGDAVAVTPFVDVRTECGAH